MNLPYQADAKSCYSDVRKVPILGEAVEKMITESQKDTPIDARVKAVLEIRSTSVERYRERPHHDAALREESAYVCAGDDLLQAAFMHELDRIAALPATERGPALDRVAGALNYTDLGPRWNTYTRPRIAGRITEIRARQ